MLYYLFDWLHKLNFPGAGMFGYTSFRALMAIILALLISSIWGDKFIKLLKRKQITETQRDAKIDPYGVNKVGVPRMGGVIIIVAILIPCLLLGKLHNIYMILMLITTVWLGSLGFADDYIKIFKKDKEGLHGKFKIIGQVGLGLIVGLTLYLSPDVVIRENIEVQTPGREMEVVHGTNDLKSTQTTIPFFKSNNLDNADLVAFMGDHAQTAGWILMDYGDLIVHIFSRDDRLFYDLERIWRDGKEVCGRRSSSAWEAVKLKVSYFSGRMHRIVSVENRTCIERKRK